MSKPKVLVCDIDGTVSKRNEMRPDPYDMSRVMFDDPVWKVIKTAHLLCNEFDLDLIMVTARENKDDCYRDTSLWLHEHTMFFRDMFMRGRRDFRPDEIVKEEIYLTKIKPFYDVEFVLDDHEPVVDMWRSHGLTCFQVAQGWSKEKASA